MLCPMFALKPDTKVRLHRRDSKQTQGNYKTLKFNRVKVNPDSGSNSY